MGRGTEWVEPPDCESIRSSDDQQRYNDYLERRRIQATNDTWERIRPACEGGSHG